MSRIVRTHFRAVGAALAFLALACSPDNIGGPDTGPGPGTGSPNGDPGAVGIYSLATVDGRATPTLIDAAVLGPTSIESYVMGGTLNLKADGTYDVAVHGRWVMNGQAINRTSAGNGTWQLVNAGTLRLTRNGGGSVDMQRTWYTLTETRKFPVDDTRDVDLIYVWVIE
jgi:hypothetical protein